jgi:hypothetical protein
VHVGRELAVGDGPLRVEVELEGGRGLRPLDLEVRGRHDHDQTPPRRLGQALARGGEGERRLPGSRSGDGEEVGDGRGGEALERGLLPGPEGDGAGHADWR